MKIHAALLVLLILALSLPSFGHGNRVCHGVLQVAAGTANPDVAFKIINKKGKTHCLLTRGAGLEKWVGKWVRVEGKPHGKLGKLTILEPMSVKGNDESKDTYTGIVKPLGVSIYMQGTHMLTDSKGKPKCLLKSGDPGIRLDRYVGKHVRLSGPSERTVEGNQTLVTVKHIREIEQ